MARLKTNLLSKFNSLLALILSFLGFTMACEQIADEYGCPNANFIVKGKVQAEDNLEVIPQIRIIMGWDTTYTDQNGFYEVIQSSFPDDQSFDASFTDVDGSTNGEFQPKDTIVEFIDPQFENGDGNWYAGEVEKVVDIMLKKK